jgi:hypothetical protein
VQRAIADVVVEDYSFPEGAERTEVNISHGGTESTEKSKTAF